MGLQLICESVTVKKCVLSQSGFCNSNIFAMLVTSSKFCQAKQILPCYQQYLPYSSMTATQTVI